EPFELRAGVEGDWNAQWEPRSGQDRMRVLWLDPPPWRAELDSLAADIRVTVEPREAVVSTPRHASISDSGDLVLPWGKGRDPIVIDPPLVRRIHYRVERVEPQCEGRKIRLFVRGAPDSEHPELAPVFAWSAALCGVLGILPSCFWLSAVQRR